MDPLGIIGIIFIVAGVLLILMALLLPQKKFGDYSIGGIILIGPIPIIFGKNLKTSLLIILIIVSLLLMILVIAMMGAWP